MMLPNLVSICQHASRWIVLLINVKEDAEGEKCNQAEVLEDHMNFGYLMQPQSRRHLAPNGNTSLKASIARRPRAAASSLGHRARSRRSQHQGCENIARQIHDGGGLRACNAATSKKKVHTVHHAFQANPLNTQCRCQDWFLT